MTAPGAALARPVRNKRLAAGITVGVNILSIAAFLAAWQWASQSFAMPTLFPSPARTFLTLKELVEDGSLWRDTVASMMRIIAGFILGSLAGFILGLLMGVSRIIRYALDPYVNFLRFISGIAWIQLATLWLGLGESSKIAVVTYVTIFAVALNTLAGFRVIPENRLRAARAFGASSWQLFWSVQMPSCIHFALQGMRLAMAGSFLTVVAAEMIAANSGLGFLINSSRQFLATDAMFVGILVLGLLGYATDKFFVFLSHTVLGRYRLGR